MSRPLLIDLETRSARDLTVSGGHLYAADPSTRLLTAAWTEDGKVIHVWCPGCDSAPEEADAEVVWHVGPENPLAALTDRVWVAHNAWTFDRPVWAALGFPEPRKWWDTYPLALAAGLPGPLHQIGVRLWGEGKMSEGQSALKKWTRAKDAEDADPRNVPAGLTWLIARYNVQDVRLLSHLWGELSATLNLPAFEKHVQLAHDVVNDRGVRIDLGLIRALKKLSQESVASAVSEIARLTGGALPDLAALRSRNKVIQWMERHGLQITTRDGGQVKPTLRREVVQQWLDTFEAGQPETAEGDAEADVAITGLDLCAKVLRLRNAAMRITEGKLDAALSRVGADGRLRGLFAYHAAHTGRWAGRGIQVQNLPRPKPGVPVWDLTRRYEATGALGYDDTLAALSQGATADDAASALLRGIFLPDEGHVLHAADLASIESRVLAWLAGETLLLDTFWKRGCPYSVMAAKLFGREVTGKKDPIRQIGKVVVLGCGYGLGADKFALYGAASGIDFEAHGITPFECVDGFRTAFPAIAGHVQGVYEGRKWRRGGFWEDLQETSLHALRNPGRETGVGKISMEMRGGHLYVTLPSGRALCYRGAREVATRTWWGKEVQALEYQSPRFTAQRMYGGKWAENVVQAVSRDFLACALVRLKDTAVLHVHDEIVCSAPRDYFPEFMRAFTTPPPWASGLPLDAEGGIMPRYAKAPPPDWPAEELWRNGEKL